jgi:hypothetical protein
MCREALPLDQRTLCEWLAQCAALRAQTRALVTSCAHDCRHSSALQAATSVLRQQSAALRQHISQQPWFALRMRYELRQVIAKTARAAALLARFQLFATGVGQPTAADVGRAFLWDVEFHVMSEDLKELRRRCEPLRHGAGRAVDEGEGQALAELERRVSDIEQAVRWLNALREQFEPTSPLPRDVSELSQLWRRRAGPPGKMPSASPALNSGRASARSQPFPRAEGRQAGSRDKEDTARLGPQDGRFTTEQNRKGEGQAGRGKVIALRRQAPTRRADSASPFGGCPHCGQSDGYVNVYDTHYFLCHQHKTMWRGGRDLFPSWRVETKETWQRNARLLMEYREVEPRH